MLYTVISAKYANITCTFIDYLWCIGLQVRVTVRQDVHQRPPWQTTLTEMNIEYTNPAYLHSHCCNQKVCSGRARRVLFSTRNRCSQTKISDKGLLVPLTPGTTRARPRNLYKHIKKPPPPPTGRALIFHQDCWVAFKHRISASNLYIYRGCFSIGEYSTDYTLELIYLWLCWRHSMIGPT